MEAEHERRELVEELKSAVQGIVDLAVHSHNAAGAEAEAVGESRSLTEQNSNVRRLLKSIEDVLHHQVKPPRFGQVPKVWKYLENLDQCLPGTTGTLQSVRQYGDSDYARVRLFIRLALNERALSEYLSALAWNQPLTTNYYKEEAILRHDESLDTVFLLLENLNKFNFALVLKDKELERPRYWDLAPVHSPPPQTEPKREPSDGDRENSAGSGAGLKALTSIVSAVSAVVEVAGVGGTVAYPAAVAPKRSKARKGRTNRRRSITLPSPPSEPQSEGGNDSASSATPSDTTTAGDEGKSESDKEKSESDSGKNDDESSDEEEHGDASDEDKNEDGGSEKQENVNAGGQKTNEDEWRQNAAGESSDGELHSESDQEDKADTELQERLKKTQERLRQLQQELSKAQASAFGATTGHGDEASPPKAEQPIATEAASTVPAQVAQDEEVVAANAGDEAKAPTTTGVAAPASNNGSGSGDGETATTIIERKASGLTAKGRAKKPKRIVSIMDAGIDEKAYHEDKLKRILDQKANDEEEKEKERGKKNEKSDAAAAAAAAALALVEDGLKGLAPGSRASVDEREELMFNMLKSVEDFTHQMLDDEASRPSSSPSPSPSPLPSPAPSPQLPRESAPPPQSSSSSLSFEKVNGWGGGAQAPPPTTTAAAPAAAIVKPTRFDKAALSSLMSLDSVTASDAIEHHHEFYPAAATLATGGSGYFSPSYVVNSPLADRVAASARPKPPASGLGSSSSGLGGAQASRWRSNAPSASGRREQVAKAPTSQGDTSDNEDEASKRDLTEADFRARQERDPSGFLLTIPAKLPASKTNSECPSCGVSLAGGGLLGGIRYCNYTGLYYCPRCHQNEKALVPAHIIRKWDMKEHKVSSWAKEYIEANLNRPTLNIASINPQLYLEVPALAQTLELRKPLTVIGEFVQTCKDRSRLTQSLAQAQREYLIENTHRYSLRDLVDVSKNRFIPFLHKVIEEYVAHITSVCAVCKGKAHFCELCADEDNLVFPFQLHRIARCEECKSYFHKACWEDQVMEAGRPCPKCERVRAMKERLQREAQREQELNLKDSYGLGSLPPYPVYKGSAGSGGGGAGRQQLAASGGGRAQLTASGRQITYVTSQQPRRGTGPSSTARSGH